MLHVGSADFETHGRWYIYPKGCPREGKRLVSNEAIRETGGMLETMSPYINSGVGLYVGSDDRRE